MPNALIPLPDVYESVTRRVAIHAVSQLVRLMQLPANTKVYLPGMAEAVPMNNGTFGNCYSANLMYPSESALIVRFNEEVDESHTLTTPVNNQEHRPVFLDEARDIQIRPVYRFVSLALTIEYNATNQVVAQRWLDEMRSRISMGRAELYLELDYHYGIPDGVMYLLQHLHSTMESSSTPSGLSFEEYLKTHLQVPTTIATTLAGTEPQWVVPEHQKEVLGWFDFTTTPQTPEAGEYGNHRATITYTFQYNRPTQWYCRYPLMVHNKPVARQFRPQTPYETYRKHTRRVSTTKGSFDALVQFLEAHGVPYVQVPETDDWTPAFIPKGRLTFFSGLIQLSPTNRRTLLDLSNLGEFQFNPYFLEYFYHQGERLFSKSESIFEFRLYENRTYRSDVKLRFKPQSVTIETDRDLDLTKYYHVQISLIRNWYEVASHTLEALRRYPTVLYRCLQALGVCLDNRAYDQLNLLGYGYPRPPNPQDPGEGQIVGDPSLGGVWPWPWLSPEWGDTPWSGEGWQSPYHTGVVPAKVMEEARHQTAAKADKYIDRIHIGRALVLYGDILTLTSDR